VASVRKLVKTKVRVRFDFSPPAQPGWYAYAVRLSAWANPQRAETLVGAVFRVD
jgi:hypothetical protein